MSTGITGYRKFSAAVWDRIPADYDANGNGWTKSLNISIPLANGNSVTVGLDASDDDPAPRVFPANLDLPAAGLGAADLFVVGAALSHIGNVAAAIESERNNSESE